MQNSILQPSDYKSDALLNELTSKPFLVPSLLVDKRSQASFNICFFRYSGVERDASASALAFNNSTTVSAFLPCLTEFDLRSVHFSLNRHEWAGPALTISE